ncbi:MAG TPA: CHC2 zinc finger domain-containing protein [Solirubrobacteraceae bacterium]|jgi:hypothetical protein|nr:CHC2 zinc finger domain-containing protein [Solirubrobacteraceae bacterium]
MDSSPSLYLDVLFARARPSTLIELRWRTATGMGRRFVTVADRAAAAQLVTEIGARTDVYVGALPRWRPQGGRAAIVGDARTVWVDLDSDVAARTLEPVDPAPSVVVASGGPGHLHVYWSLTAGAAAGVIERANRRLAWALGGDLNSADAARILRPPATVHHGRGGAEVRLMGGGGAPARLGDLVGGLADPPGAAAPSSRTRPSSRRRGDALLELEPERYVARLTGRRVGRSRKVRCPLHEDGTPSLHVYREPQRGWYCFGCRRGGSVYDLAAALWRIEPRGASFVALRERLTSMFG